MAAPQMQPPGSDRAEADYKSTDTEIVCQADADRKELASTQALFAMVGVELIPLSDGTFLACRWNLSKALPDLRAARQFLKLIGGAQ